MQAVRILEEREEIAQLSSQMSSVGSSNQSNKYFPSRVIELPDNKESDPCVVISYSENCKANKTSKTALVDVLTALFRAHGVAVYSRAHEGKITDKQNWERQAKRACLCLVLMTECYLSSSACQSELVIFLKENKFKNVAVIPQEKSLKVRTELQLSENSRELERSTV